MLEDRLDHRPDRVVVADVQRLERSTRRRARRRGDEVAPELADEERAVEPMADAEAAGILPVVPPALAEDPLAAGVVALAVVAEVDGPLVVVPVVPPAGQRPRLLADVALRVTPARAEREQLHQLAAVVLVRRALLVVGPAEPEEHRRVLRDGEQELLERAEPAAAEEAVLFQHQPLGADAGVRGREPVVPDERHPLDERPARPHHPVEPPEVVVAPGVGRRDPMLVVVDGSRADEPLALRPRQRADGVVEALPREPLGLTRSRAETGAPKKPFGLNRPEAASVDGNFACGRHREIPCSASVLYVLG